MLEELTVNNSQDYNWTKYGKKYEGTKHPVPHHKGRSSCLDKQTNQGNLSGLVFRIMHVPHPWSYNPLDYQLCVIIMNQSESRPVFSGSLDAVVCSSQDFLNSLNTGSKWQPHQSLLRQNQTLPELMQCSILRYFRRKQVSLW